MHPIEQLRFVARAAGADAGLLVQEAASALSVFRSDPAALLVAGRRLLARQPSIGPLWWLITRMVLASDPAAAGRAAIAELHGDRTSRELAHALRSGSTVAVAGWPSLTVDALGRRGDVSVLVLDIEGQGAATARRLERSDVDAEAVDGGRVGGVVADCDVVVVEAGAAGSSAALVDVGSAGLAATANALGVPVWLVCGVGRRLPEPYWQELAQRSFDQDLPGWLQNHEIITFGLVDRVVTADGVVDATDWAPSDLGVAAELLGPAPI